MTLPAQRRAILKLVRAAHSGDLSGISKGSIEKLLKALSGENATFVCHALTRGDVAEQMNSVLDRPEFAPDDRRLTDALCERVAELEADFLLGGPIPLIDPRDEQRYVDVCELLFEEILL